MSLLVGAGGASATHIFKCKLVADEFSWIYRPRAVGRTVGVAYAATLPDIQITHRAPREGGWVLGHLSNLSVAKGLEVVIRLGRAAVDSGLVRKVIVAGPIAGKREEHLVEKAVADGYVEYRGSLYGRAKDAFFQDVHVFVMPSKYKNELSPLVVWEAQLSGLPVITYRVGCLTQAGVGKGSLVIDTTGDFVDAALRQIEAWAKSPSDWELASANSLEFATAHRLRAIRDVLAMGAQLFDYRS